jgi:C-terminal processing protease CtpA/Prc
VSNPVAYVDDVREMGIIGNGVFANFTVTFDLRNMRLRLQRDGDEPIFAPGVGPNMTFNMRGNKVVSVVAGGMADRAGVRIGDEIVSMNGQSAKPGEDTYTVKNWPENQPLILELRRGGQPIRVELNVKPLVR